MAQWLTAPEFAGLAKMDRRSAARVLAASLEGRTWRGHQLEVRTVHGRGGRSGLAYEVSLRSLSEALPQAAPPAVAASPHRTPRQAAAHQEGRVAARWAVLQPILAHPAGSAERAAAFAAAVGPKTSERTLRRWIEAEAAEGVQGLANRRPENAGQARVVVTRRFDRAFLAAGHSPEALARVGEVVTPAIKGLWKGRSERVGWRMIGRDAGSLLYEACLAQGTPVAEADCFLTRRRVEAFAHYRIVNTRRNDRKAYEDAAPDIVRTGEHLDPMEIVVADVKPLDIIVRRADGSEGWPRIIGFHDWGTGRLFVYPVLCDKGESIRQEHVNEAFIALASTYGFPRAIYMDNGSEMKGLVKLSPVLALLNEADARTIIHARPYRGRSKPVEPAFARLDRIVTPVFESYAGKDRMVKKTQTVGRPPKPYPGSEEQFMAEFCALVEDMNHTPFVSGAYKELSSAEILAEKTSAAWRPIFADPLAIDAAFCERTEKTLRRGAVSHNGVRYTHERLPAVLTTKVQVALPWRRSAHPLFELDGVWSYLKPDRPFDARDIQGVHTSAARQNVRNRAVAALVNDGPIIDAVPIRFRRQARRPAQGAAAVLLPLDAGGRVTSLARGLTELTVEAVIAMTEEERAKLIQRRETEALLKEDAANAA